MTDLPLRCPSCGHSSGDTLVAIPHHTPRIDLLLRSNERPTDDEERAFQKFVIEGESQIRSLENRIEQAKNSLNQLEADLKRTQVAVKEHKDMLNPAKRLPFDILREIFLVGVGLGTDVGSHFRSTSHSLDLNSPPWVYGRVCHFWNEVTLNTPRLWTRIKVVRRQIAMKRQFYATTSVTVKGREYRSTGTGGWRMPLSLSLLSLYLGRSGSLPLAVYLDFNSIVWSSEGMTDFAQVFSAMLFLTSRRWVSLSLAGNLPTAFSNDSFPLLKYIQSEEEGIRVDDLIDITAPRLWSWSTLGHKPRSVMITMSPRLCSQITEYSISHVSTANALKIIEQLLCLLKLTVREITEGESRESPLSLAVLSELILEQSTASDINKFIDSISCPALTSLYITTHVSVVESIQNLEARSSFSLECMDISAQADLSLIKTTVGIKKLAVRAIGKALDYRPFVSLHDVLSPLSVMSAGSSLESFNKTEDSESSAASYLANTLSTSAADDAGDLRSEEAVVSTDTENSSSPASERLAIGDDIEAAVSDDHSSPDRSSIPFPNLQRLELHFCSSPVLKDSDIMAELLTCVVSRSTSPSEGITNITVTLAEIFIASPDHLAREMLNHPYLKVLRSIGLKVDILGF